MGITETIVIYGIIGATVAAAIWLSGEDASATEAVIHTLLWPMFAPTLLESQESRRPKARAPNPTERDEPRIREIESGLLSALEALEGAPEDVLRPEINKIRGLMDSLDAMATRRDDMYSMLQEPQFDHERATRLLDELEHAEDSDPARVDSVRNRIERIDRLENMHRALSRDIDHTLLRLEDMTSQVRLLRFADSPAQEVSDLVRDITSTVEGLSEGLLAQA